MCSCALAKQNLILLGARDGEMLIPRRESSRKEPSMLALIRGKKKKEYTPAAVLLLKFDRFSLSTRIRAGISELCFRVFHTRDYMKIFGTDPTTIDKLASEQD